MCQDEDARPGKLESTGCVTGKNKMWLHVGSVSFTLTFASRCFCSLKEYCLYCNGLPQGNLPLCLNVKPKCLCSGKHPAPAHLWMAARKKELTHPLPEAGHSRRCLQDLMVFLLYFPTSSPSLFYKRNWHPEPRLDGSFETLVCHLLRLPAFRIKLYSLPQHLVSRFTGLLCGEQSELRLGNRRTVSVLQCRRRAEKKWAEWSQWG